MCSWFLLTVALVSALFGLSQSLCSPCPFQWMENGNYCYRYFPQNLSYDEAEMFCKQFSHTGHVAELATVSTFGELTFIVEYMDKIITSLPSTDIPRRVWLKNTTKAVIGKWKLFAHNQNCILKAVGTIGNCQRLAFTVGTSQHMHKITNLWKVELNQS